MGIKLTDEKKIESKKESTRVSKDMFEQSDYYRVQIGGERIDKEFINKHIQLINNLSSLSKGQLIAFVNILSINDPELFNRLKEVTEWESKILSEFMKKEN